MRSWKSAFYQALAVIAVLLGMTIVMGMPVLTFLIANTYMDAALSLMYAFVVFFFTLVLYIRILDEFTS